MNVRGFGCFFGVAAYFGIAASFLYLGWAKDCGDEEDVAYAWKVVKRVFTTAALLTPFMLIPSMDELWSVRIGLIKFQLASPEHVQKGAETIERIAKKLECKYVGGSECSEKKESK
jgi:hypothetical protein